MAKSKAVGYAKYRLSPLKKITDLAKQIRKKNPSMKYTDAVKKAGAQYRSGKTAKAAPKKAAKKKAAVRKPAAKKTARKKSPAAKQGALFGKSASVGMAANAISMRNNLEKEIAWCETLMRWQYKGTPKTPEDRRKKKTVQLMLKNYKKQLRELNAVVYQTLGRPK